MVFTYTLPRRRYRDSVARYFNEPRYVYLLIDPRDGKVRYVGMTMDSERRLASHRSTNRAKPIGAWMEELAAAGVEPILAVVDAIRGPDARERERDLINLYRQSGAPLLNGKGGRSGRFNRRGAVCNGRTQRRT